MKTHIETTLALLSEDAAKQVSFLQRVAANHRGKPIDGQTKDSILCANLRINSASKAGDALYDFYVSQVKEGSESVLILNQLYARLIALGLEALRVRERIGKDALPPCEI